MKVIETKGITYLEKFPDGMEWYWGTDYSCGDLYESEEVFQMGKRFEPNRLIFVRASDGIVFEPIVAKENQYFGTPAYIDGVIYFFIVDFAENLIRVFQYSSDFNSVLQSTTNFAVSLCLEIPLNKVKDCYNLRIDGSPLMLTRQSGDNHFQVIWPEEVDFVIGNRENFLFRKEEKLFFSEWYEDPTYREEINIRAYPSGKLIEKIVGSVMTTSDGQHWILR